MFDPHGICVPATAAEYESLRRRVRHGEAVRLAPRVFATTAAAQSVTGCMHAAMAWCPDGVLVGAAAARLTFWPDCPLTHIELAHPTRSRAPEWITIRRIQIEPSWVLQQDRLRFTHPALTAAILAGTDLGGTAVDEALRRGVALADIQAAPTKGWPGYDQRRTILAASRDQPWSAAERKAHELLRKSGITGWRANGSIRVPGRVYKGDIVFRAAKLLVEIDGFEYHADRSAFEADRRRQNELVLAGWTVLRFTWAMLDEPGLFVRTVRIALAD